MARLSFYLSGQGQVKANITTKIKNPKYLTKYRYA